MSRTDFHLGPSPAAAGTAPLTGVNLLITRPVMPASRTATRVAALGAVPFVFPTTIIEPPANAAPLATALAQLPRDYAAIFVSPSAAEMTLAPMGSAPRKLPESLRVFAPGPGTAEELQRLGVATVVIPESTFDSEGLLALPALQAAAVSGRRIAIFRGNDGRELLREALTLRGAVVDAITAYHRRAPQTPPTGLLELLRSKQINAISAMSSDAVTHLVALVPESERSALLVSLPVYASHERIAAIARAAGFRRVIETGPGDAGLITALLAHGAT
ncbi:MAG: uroporphyrinogen-III synthase [Burkholderiales bacterium]|nr:uroporphyrinogen-III synthase [Burkholderiales bacterium]